MTHNDASCNKVDLMCKVYRLYVTSCNYIYTQLATVCSYMGRYICSNPHFDDIYNQFITCSSMLVINIL